MDDPTSHNNSIDYCSSPNRRRSTSYLAVKEALYQLTCLNDFICEDLGAGFFADVYKVVHKTTGEVMVLKMNKYKDNKKQMLDEIQLLNRLSHPNILGFKGSCVHEGQLHALTEFINGGTLEDMLHDPAIILPWSVRVKMIADIARGMAYLHSKRVSHRDLTSKNVLLQKYPDGSLKTVVADFGLAAKIKHKRQSYTEAVGTAYWMAPECLRGKKYCEKADVFSYSILLAEIMSRLPADPEYIPRKNDFSLDTDALRLLVDQDCPPSLWQLCLQCCQYDPDDRPTFDNISQTTDAIIGTMANNDCTITRRLISSQSEPILLLPLKENTDGSYEFTQQQSQITQSASQCDLEDTLTSLLDNGTNTTTTQQKRQDFIIHAITSTPDHKTHGGGAHGGGDSGIDPGFWIKSVPAQRKDSVESTPEHKTNLRFEKTNSPLINGSIHYRDTSDSSEISFHLPSPSYAWAPPPSPTFQHKSFSFSSSPPTVSSITDYPPPIVKSNSAPTNEVGVFRHSSQPLALSCINHTSYSTPNL